MSRPQPAQRPHVVIIGAGLAGLSAAEALARAAPHVAVTLLESRRAAGGRAGSFLDPATGQSVDYCQHVAMGCCTNLLGLLQACGLSDSFLRYDRLEFHHPTAATSTFAASGWLPAPLHLLPTLAALRYLSPEQRRQVRRATWRLMRCRSESLRGDLAGDWLVAHGQDAATIRDYWNVIIASALGEACEAVSMAAVRKVFVDGFLAARGASDLWVPQRPLSELFGRDLPAAIGRLGVRLQTQAAVRAVEEPAASAAAADPAEGLGGLVHFRDTQMFAQHVILAVPWHQLHRLVAPPLAARAGLAVQRWTAVPAAPISGVHLWFDRPITDRPHGVLVGTLAQWLFGRPGPTAAHGRQHYYQVVISAAHAVRRMTSEQVVRQVVGELRQAFPAATAATLMHSRVVTDPQAVFSLNPVVEALRPAATTALPWLHLAGDFVQTGWPATMEGAVISGRQAANSVLCQLGGTPVEISQGLPRGWLSRRLIRR